MKTIYAPKYIRNDLAGRCRTLERYAKRAGLKWSVAAIDTRTELIRLIDTSDDCHDVTMQFSEAVELFESMANVAALGCY